MKKTDALKNIGVEQKKKWEIALAGFRQLDKTHKKIINGIFDLYKEQFHIVEEIICSQTNLRHEDLSWSVLKINEEEDVLYAEAQINIGDESEYNEIKMFFPVEFFYLELDDFRKEIIDSIQTKHYGVNSDGEMEEMDADESPYSPKRSRQISDINKEELTEEQIKLLQFSKYFDRGGIN